MNQISKCENPKLKDCVDEQAFYRKEKKTEKKYSNVYTYMEKCRPKQ